MTVPQRLCSLHSCQTAILPHVATSWHILAHVGMQPSPHFFHGDNSFSGSIKNFHLKLALGLALGKSWTLLAQRLKDTRVQCLPVFIFVGRLS